MSEDSDSDSDAHDVHGGDDDVDEVTAPADDESDGDDAHSLFHVAVVADVDDTGANKSC